MKSQLPKDRRAQHHAGDDGVPQQGLIAQHLHHRAVGQGADDKGAHGAHFLEHVAVAHTGGHALVHREGPRQDEQCIQHHGDEAQCKAELPHGIEEQFCLRQQHTEERA